ncbi:MAG: DUF5719 family protein [Acidimicrobiales bacterium]
MTRWTAVIVLIGLLVAGVAYDRVDIAPVPEPEVSLPEPVSPAIDASGSLSTVWFCPVGSGSAEGIGLHTLALTNAGDTDAVATINLLNGSGPGPSARIDLPPRSTETFEVAELDQSNLVGAVVEIVGGEGVVGHNVATNRGITQAPCGTETSDSWYFADGTTTRDSSQFIVLLNPFSQDVVFDVEFQTATRTRVPDDLQAAVVPGRSVRLINVGDYVSREANVATKITSVQGRFAVERLQFFDGQLGPSGVALTSAAIAPRLEWYLPAGRVHDGGDQRVTIYNPGESTAEIDLEFDLADPADRSSYGLVPVEITIAGGRIAVIDLVEELSRAGYPLPAELGVTLRSTNDVGIVAERWQVTPKIDTSLIGAGGTNASIGFGRAPRRFQDGEDVESQDNAIPDPSLEPEVVPLIQATATAGVGISHGSSVLSDRWVVPWMTIGEGEQSVLVVTAPAGALVEVQLMVAGELLPPVRSAVPAEGRAQIPLAGPVADAAVVVTSDAPVAVEVQVVTPEGRLAVIPGVPSVTPIGPAAQGTGANE